MTARKAFTVFLVLLFPLALFPGGIVAAKVPVPANEIVRDAVVSTLAPDGAVESTVVAQLIQLSAKDGEVAEVRVPRALELESYRNLSGFSGPDGEGEDLVWRTSDHLDATALAKGDRELPVSVRVRYSLDGKEVSAEDIKGRSGDVKISIELENVSGEPQTLEHEAVTSPYLTSVVTRYIPMDFIVRADFPSDEWDHVGGTGVAVRPAGDTEVASASGVLDPPLTPARQTVTFEGHSDDILTPHIQIFATPRVSQQLLDSLQTQYEALQALYGGMDSISKNLDKIRDGVLQLVDGAESMLDGVGERDPDTGEGVVVKDDKGKTTTLLGGLQSSKDTYDDDLIPGADKALEGIKQMIAALEGPAADLVGGLGDIADGLGLLIGSLQTDDVTDPGFREGMELVRSGLTALLANLQTDDLGEPGFREGLELLVAGLGDTSNPPDLLSVIGVLETMLGGLGNTANPPDIVTIIGTLETLQTNAAGASAAAAFGVAPFPLPDPVAAFVLDGLADGIAGLLASIQTNQLTGFDDDGDGDVDEDPINGADNDLDGDVDEDGVSGFREGFLGLLGNLQTDQFTDVDDDDDGDVDEDGGVAGFDDDSDGDIDEDGTSGFSEGLQGLLAGLGDVGDPPNDTTVIGAIQLLIGGMDQLLDGLGEAGEDTPDPETIIGALELMYAGILQAAPGSAELVEGILGGLSALSVGFTNAAWTQPQAALGGRTPKEYFQDCPGCFDPEFKAFDAATAAFTPGFRDVFVLFSEGLDEALKELHTFDDADPGLVDGLEQVRGALQQVGQGLFAVDELGVSTIRGQVGDEGNAVGRNAAALRQGADDAAHSSVVAAGADTVSTTYVFELAAQSDALRDNATRGALLALVLAGLAMVARRPRFFGL